MNITEIDAQIEALKVARINAQKVANEASKEAFAAIPRVFDWRVEWKDDYSLTIDCRMTADTEAAFQAWKAQYPTSTISMPEFKWHGMRHLLIGNVLVTAWGGSIILNIPRDCGKDYYELNDTQVAALRAGNVPEELRRPW